MEMLFVDVPAGLRDQVIGLWSLRGYPNGLYSGLPKPFVEMVISLSGHHFWQEGKLAKPIDFTKGWVTPIQSGPRFAKTSGGLHLIGARLSIDAASVLFGIEINRGTGPPVPLDCVIGRDANILREELLDIETETGRLSRLGEWLLSRLKDSTNIMLPSTNELIKFGWRTDALAAHMGLSSRGLRKRFQTQLGIGPKFWLQLNRFDKVLSGPMPSIGLAKTAIDFGYTDQAHMTSEFKRFAGHPPGEYLKARSLKFAPDDAPHFVPSSE